MSGNKNDAGKPDLSLLPLPAIEQMAKALMYGERKYGRYNYCQGFDEHRLIGAALRHVFAFQNGEDLDPESGHSHLGHAMASLAMLLHNRALGTGTDTRYKPASVPGHRVTPGVYTVLSSSDVGSLTDRFDIDERRGVMRAENNGV